MCRGHRSKLPGRRANRRARFSRRLDCRELLRVRVARITRAMGYLLINEGKIRSVSLRRRGHATGVRLVDVASVREFLKSKAEEVPMRQRSTQD